VKEFSKSVNSWWSYCKNSTLRFWDTVYIYNHYYLPGNGVLFTVAFFAGLTFRRAFTPFVTQDGRSEWSIRWAEHVPVQLTVSVCLIHHELAYVRPHTAWQATLVKLFRSGRCPSAADIAHRHTQNDNLSISILHRNNRCHLLTIYARTANQFRSRKHHGPLVLTLRGADVSWRKYIVVLTATVHSLIFIWCGCHSSFLLWHWWICFSKEK